MPLAGLLILAIAGCGTPDDVGPTIPVSGTVTVDGKPLNEGAVVFVPDDSKGNKAKVTAQGSVDKGSFTLASSSVTTTKPGAPPGWYKVTINTSAPMGTGKGTVPSDPTKVDPKAAQPKSTPIAQKYTDLARTPLVIEVKEGATYEIKAESR